MLILSNNTKVTSEVKNEWQSYVNRLSSGSDIAIKEINDINLRLKVTESNMRNMGKLGFSWTDKLKQAWGKFGGWGFATGTMMTLFNQLRRIPKEVYEIDTAMTNLYKVTDETSSKYNQFLDSASDSAHELGRSISSLVEQTANWAKLGFSLDEAEQLAKISSIYANVGEVDNDTAVSDMVTAMKAFNIEASDSITIVDKLNKLGNEYATSAAALGDGLSRSASAMATSGTDINKTLAMLTGGTEITQNASEFGNFLKVGSMRIRGMKGDLEALGEEVDETVDSISKVQTQILNRTGGKVNIFDDMGNFRDYYDIMEDIAEVYDDLNDPDKADLTEILFGKQRGNQGAALIQAFQSGRIQKALEATLNAEGSAMQEQERWLESLEAKTQQFEAAFQSLSSTVLDSSLLKWFVDFGTGTVSTLDTIIDKFGTLNTMTTIGGGIAGAKGLG
jgi:TP901 family phage tail tape measure protein